MISDLCSPITFTDTTMLLTLKLIRCGVVAVGVVALAGCGRSKSDIVPVTGTLTYKGVPVTNAILTFEPDHARQSWAETDNQGHFKIFYDAQQDGVALGTHKVFIEFRATTDAEKDLLIEGKQPPMSAEMKAFFNKYSPLNSKLTVQITQKTRDLKLDLD
jgi:hypothetical protein